MSQDNEKTESNSTGYPPKLSGKKSACRYPTVDPSTTPPINPFHVFPGPSTDFPFHVFPKSMGVPPPMRTAEALAI